LEHPTQVNAICVISICKVCYKFFKGVLIDVVSPRVRIDLESALYPPQMQEAGFEGGNLGFARSWTGNSSGEKPRRWDTEYSTQYIFNVLKTAPMPEIHTLNGNDPSHNHEDPNTKTTFAETRKRLHSHENRNIQEDDAAQIRIKEHEDRIKQLEAQIAELTSKKTPATSHNKVPLLPWQTMT
jgi:hypothetical protein